MKYNWSSRGVSVVVSGPQKAQVDVHYFGLLDKYGDLECVEPKILIEVSEATGINHKNLLYGY
jgi:hypothetical protein